jgi:glutathione synthase/RimK-type ligase-like ATP-grasp enzyme
MVGDGWRNTAPDGVPLVHGTARLASLLYAGHGFGHLLDMLGAEPTDPVARAGWLMDRAWLYWLNFSPYQASQFQQHALAGHGVFRVRGRAEPMRLLALCAPGDLMVNAPLDFLAPGAGVRLDLAFIRPGLGLPAGLPDHDVAIVAASESAPAALLDLVPVFARWHRPILNNPSRIVPMSRDWLAQTFDGLPGVLVAPTTVMTRAELAAGAVDEFPALLRPVGSHAGHGLMKADGAGDVAHFLSDTDSERVYVSRFIDYRGGNGWYAKYRIAFVDGAPFICHMASSEHWMVHYLNAGMDGNEAKRTAEQQAMESFDTGFAVRHRLALAAIVKAMGLDYFSIDCAEAPDGRLLVFEADVAAIIHTMDPPDIYPYKQAAMARCYDAFGQMLRRRARPSTELPPSVGQDPVRALLPMEG